MAKKPGSATNAKSGLKGWQRNLLIHLGILVAAYVVIAVYFFPATFEGKVPDQHDIIEYQGMAKETNDFREETGEEALWVSTLFSGMPAFQASIRHFGNWFWQINQLLWFGLPRPANYIFMMFAGFFFLLRVLKVNPWLSGAGAAAFAFSSYFFIILDVGHTSKANAIAYMAPILASILLTYRGKYLLGGVLTACFVALQMTSNHYQITYYTILIIAVMAIFMLVDALRNEGIAKFIKASAILLVAGVIGVGPTFGNLWTTLQYASQTMRGETELTTANASDQGGLDIEYAYRWSYGVGETMTLLIPNFYGGASQVEVDRDTDTYKEIRRAFGNSPQVSQILENFPAYWGDQPGTSGPVYVGAIIVFLFLLGLLVVEGPARWWLLTATILSLLLSWGKNLMWFNELMFNYFPAYNKFRAPSMALIIAEFTMPILGFLGLQKVLETERKGPEWQKMQRMVLIAGGITAGLSLLFAVAGSALLSFSGPVDSQMGQLAEYLEDYRQSIFTRDAFRSFGLIAATAAIIWFYLRNNIKSAVPVYVALAVLILIDMIPVAARYLNEDSFITKRTFDANFAPTRADQAILQDTDPNYRVLNLTTSTFNDAKTSYHHKSIGGYHAAKLQRYNDMIGRHIQPEMQQLIGTLQNQQELTDSVLRGALAQLDVLNMLNTRYFIINPQGMPLQNSAAMGNAWFVQNIQQVNSPDEEIAAINQVNVRNTAVVDVSYEEGRFGDQLEGVTAGQDPNAAIVQTDWKPNYIAYQTNSGAEGVVVFSEIYYNGGKGWNAYLDNEPVPHFRANYILRGMTVPAGSHIIEFRFEPEAYWIGNQVALVFSILLVLGLLGAFAYEFLQFRKKEQQEEA